MARVLACQAGPVIFVTFARLKRSVPRAVLVNALLTAFAILRSRVMDPACVTTAGQVRRVRLASRHFSDLLVRRVSAVPMVPATGRCQETALAHATKVGMALPAVNALLYITVIIAQPVHASMEFAMIRSLARVTAHVHSVGPTPTVQPVRPVTLGRHAPRVAARPTEIVTTAMLVMERARVVQDGPERCATIACLVSTAHPACRARVLKTPHVLTRFLARENATALMAITARHASHASAHLMGPATQLLAAMEHACALRAGAMQRVTTVRSATTVPIALRVTVPSMVRVIKPWKGTARARAPRDGLAPPATCAPPVTSGRAAVRVSARPKAPATRPSQATAPAPAPRNGPVPPAASVPLATTGPRVRCASAQPREPATQPCPATAPAPVPLVGPEPPATSVPPTTTGPPAVLASNAP